MVLRATPARAARARWLRSCRFLTLASGAGGTGVSPATVAQDQYRIDAPPAPCLPEPASDGAADRADARTDRRAKARCDHSANRRAQHGSAGRADADALVLLVALDLVEPGFDRAEGSLHLLSDIGQRRHRIRRVSAVLAARHTAEPGGIERLCHRGLRGLLHRRIELRPRVVELAADLVQRRGFERVVQVG